MDAFTYQPPDPHQFLHTLREMLEGQNSQREAALLAGAEIEFVTNGQYSRGRWNAFDAVFRVRVPVERVSAFDKTARNVILKAACLVLPSVVGYDLSDVEITAFLESPPDEDSPLPGPTWKPDRLIRHDGLYFRSRTETKIYDSLKPRLVLFFANATAVLGGRDIKREPDFLVCQEGKWGILEVMGEHYHPAETAMRDHDRGRLFNDYGVALIQFYDARRCYQNSDEVVQDFLERLRRS